MKRKNAARNALFTSILSLLLCVSMLVGTTFAWFTDEVTSGRNVIAAGNLDVELLANGVEVDEGTVLFDGVDPELWEPGALAYENLQVANVGTLALQYILELSVLNETNVNGYKLSDVIKVGIVDGGVTATTREDAIAEVTTWTALKDFELDQTAVKLKAGEKSDVFGVVLYWQPNDNEVDNRYNMNNENQGKVLQLDIGVNLIATQVMHEDDSFGNDYDEDADPATVYIPTGKALHDSTATSGKYALAADFKTSDYGDDARYGWGYEYIIRNQADYTLDLNGKTLTHDTVNENANKNAFTYTFVANHAGTKLTINGDGTVHSNNSAGYTCAIQGKDGTLITVNGGDYQVDNGIAVWAGAGAHIVINDGSFVNGNANTDHELIYSSGGVIDIYGGFFHNKDGNYTLNIEDRNRATGFINVYGGTYVNFDPSTGGQDPNNIKVMDGYKVVSETQENGDVWYTVVPKQVDSVEELAAALNAGNGNIVLADGEYKMPSSTTSGNITITGNEDTVLDVTKGAYLDSANVTIKGVTIKTSTGYVMDDAGNQGSDYAALYTPNVTYINCTFEGPMRVGRDGAKFINCTFNNLGNDYIWTYGNDVTFEGCTFNTDGKAILIYSDGGNEISQVTVKGCTFNSTQGAKAGAIANQNCAAIEIHNYGNGVNLTTSGNTYDSNFSGEWRIKTYETGRTQVIVNGVEYTTIAIDGKTMTIDANKNVTVNG